MCIGAGRLSCLEPVNTCDMSIDIQEDYTRRETDTQFHDSGEKAGLERQIWEYYFLLFYLKP